ncbi:4-diphosphocytidyl-2C-methyl-D-erythritol synthase [Actinocatenispora thailandica]|uniref:4-diphosphocytidyl-2C-methyl-D-erythritol synthase n=1 Tax=Actinocatenispora thailandica TaxID=227318 RepID=A0A7R7HWP8_9ACTN|nr:nucleotidyltransferase family protein [Actinocatenispora thailandica]BCJ34313.1 4-diphosphocytidyl-2C-methyl-D-erythritol synthase [Actinocatenispora thailandica]
MTGTTVAGLLLAAGAGRRFGRPKALVSFRGRTLLEHGVALLTGGGCDPVYVVSGAAPLTCPGATVVANPGWATGMGSSLRAGVEALPARVDAVVVALVDQPLVGPAAVRRLLAAYRRGARLAVAGYAGRPRNPVLLSREYWPGVLASARGDRGARGYLRSHPELVTLVDCDGTGSPADIDTPEDLDSLSG